MPTLLVGPSASIFSEEIKSNYFYWTKDSNFDINGWLDSAVESNPMVIRILSRHYLKPLNSSGKLQ